MGPLSHYKSTIVRGSALQARQGDHACSRNSAWVYSHSVSQTSRIYIKCASNLSLGMIFGPRCSDLLAVIVVFLHGQSSFPQQLPSHVAHFE